MRNMLKCFIGAGCLALALGAAPAAAEPALFKVSDKDSTLYLFGTVHALPEGEAWRTPDFEKAFAGAAEIWFEADVSQASDPAVMAPLQALFIDPANPLSKRLSAEEHARFLAAAQKLGLPGPQLDPLRPWAVALQLTAVSLAKAGIKPEQGVEAVLTAELGERKLRTLETVEQQLRFLAGLSPESEKEFLLATLKDIDEGPAYFERLKAAWASGDVQAMETLFLPELRSEYPETYEALLKRRNLAWVEQLDAELKGAGVDFVAVGAAHLVGPDSVAGLLKVRGYKVEQVQPAKERKKK